MKSPWLARESGVCFLERIMNTSFDSVTIETIASNGHGVARLGEKTIFVPGALPGDVIRGTANLATFPITVTDYEMRAPSPDRCAHPCLHHDACRGSSLGNFDYAAQCDHKGRALRHTLRKNRCETIHPVVPSPQPWHYRQRLSLSVWNQRGLCGVGYKIEARQASGIEIQQCKLALPEVEAGATHVAAVLSKSEFVQQLMPLRVQIHATQNGAGALLMFDRLLAAGFRRDWQRRLQSEALRGGVWVGSGNQLGLPHASSQYAAVVQASDMSTTWLGRPIDLHPAAFCQTNPAVADLICVALQEQFAGRTFRRIWDLYGGWGMLSLSLADVTDEITVVELSPYAERTAEKMAEERSVRSFRFLNEDVTAAMQARAAELHSDDLVVLDPPASGLHMNLLKVLETSAVRTLAYLSCHPAKLARDAQLLGVHGFQLRVVIPFDMFPQTPELEVLAIMERGEE